MELLVIEFIREAARLAGEWELDPREEEDGITAVIISYPRAVTNPKSKTWVKFFDFEGTGYIQGMVDYNAPKMRKFDILLVDHRIFNIADPGCQSQIIDWLNLVSKEQFNR